MPGTPSRRLAAILHADVVGSTGLVQSHETLAHERIRDAFEHFSKTIAGYGGTAHEIRGDALVAEFARASDAVCAALAFQSANAERNEALGDDVRPDVRVGISLGEVVIADGTLTGAGVVLAQRLEQLAAAGGVVVQGSVSETVPARFPFAYESLGEQLLKGFDREVRAFAVSLDSGKTLPEPDPGPAEKETIPDTNEKPSIAVLPFTNMSGDPEQEYFSDGISEDIITDMSKLSGLSVIARNSSFTYKGKPASAAEVSRDLGVRYVLYGSVRRAGDRVRVTAELVDSGTERQLWAERYDRDLDDIFALQDELSRKVVAATAVRLTANDTRRLAHRPTESVEAYDYVLRGREQLSRHTRESNAKALELFDKAIEQHPDYANAYGHRAETLLQQVQLGWTDSAEDALDGALENANRAVELDNDLGLGHGVLGQIYLWQGRFDEAVSEGERRVALEPGDAEGIATLALTHAFSGDGERTLELIATAMRLDPHYPFWHLHAEAMAHMALENYREAIAVERRAIVRNPDSMPVRMVLAACLALAGEQAAAEEELAEYQRINPDLSIRFVSEQVPYRRRSDRERLLEGLRKAGLE
jgi:TolB-like protein/Flp pilus assembly protein TadD